MPIFLRRETTTTKNTKNTKNETLDTILQFGDIEALFIRRFEQLRGPIRDGLRPHGQSRDRETVKLHALYSSW